MVSRFAFREPTRLAEAVEVDQVPLLNHQESKSKATVDIIALDRFAIIRAYRRPFRSGKIPGRAPLRGGGAGGHNSMAIRGCQLIF